MTDSQQQQCPNQCESRSTCPVQDGVKSGQCPASSDKSSGCPVDEKVRANYRHPHVYNVYGERIDPANHMAANPNQNPAPGQREPLSTDRVQSTIPKGGTDGTWLCNISKIGLEIDG